MTRSRRNSGAVTALAIAAGFAASLLLAAPSAHATFVLGTGNIGNLGDNVIVNNCVGNVTGPAALVQGCLNSSHTTLVNVSTAPPPATAALLANGGQARFEGSNGASAADITNFTINFANPSTGIGGLVLNINADANSNVTFTVHAVSANGTVEPPQVFNNTLSGSGNNFFNLTTADGEVATSITVGSSATNIVDIRQVRLIAAAVPQPPIRAPEPASLAILGGALIGFGLLRRRKKV